MGISTIWTMMPGIAVVIAPAQNADRPNAVTSRPAHRKRATPQTNLPATIAVSREM